MDTVAAASPFVCVSINKSRRPCTGCLACAFSNPVSKWFPFLSVSGRLLYHAIQDFISPRIPLLFAARFTQTNRRSTSRLRLSPRPFHRSYHPIARRRGQRNKFIVCRRQRKAVFVLTPRRIWSQRRNAHAIFHLYRSCIPLMR